MPKPSKRVRGLFTEVEIIADQLLELKNEEDRLREMLEKVWQARTVAMSTLAIKSKEASDAEVEEFSAKMGLRP